MSRDRDALLGTVLLTRGGDRFLVLALDEVTKDRVQLLMFGIAVWLDGSELRRLVARGDLMERAARIVPETAAQLAGAAS